jgi:hypothetical protein
MIYADSLVIILRFFVCISAIRIIVFRFHENSSNCGNILISWDLNAIMLKALLSCQIGAHRKQACVARMTGPNLTV